MKGGKKDEREAFAAAIRGAGLRVTASRIQVLSALKEADAPLSHADVAARLEGQGLDRTTLYRNLVDLAEVGILRRTDVEHTWRFELVANGEGELHGESIHPHFVCTDCGKVACLPAGVVALKPQRGSPQALRRGDLEIQLRGVCDACA
jgi:Fur family transcriptional regulator, ferric uptake regulator